MFRASARGRPPLKQRPREARRCVRMSENDTAAFVFLMVFGLPTAGWVIVRLMRHMERMEMIKRGMLPPEDDRNRSQSFARAQTPPPTGQPYVSYPSTWNMGAQASLRRGVVTTAIGVALLIGLSFIGYHRDGTFELGPWLLGGLIPMFVGLAQIANAMLSGAQFPRVGVQVGPIPPQPPPAGSPPPPPSGPYTYRPGATEELPRTKPPQSQ